MGLNKRGGEEEEEDVSVLSEYLLFATMCMVGLPVEVQVKDGSLYCGILHTASFDKGNGIVLKKARKIGKGKCEKSFTVGTLIDTLIVFSADLVQVVAKNLILPAAGVIGNFFGDGAATATSAQGIETQACNFDPEREPNPLISSNNSPSGIVDHNKGKISLYDLNNKDAKVDKGLDVRKVLRSTLENKQELEDKRQDMEKAVELSLSPILSVQERQVREDMPHGEANSCNRIDEVSEAKKMVHEHEDHCLSPSNASPPQVDSVYDAHGATPAAWPVRPDDHPESKSANSTSLPSSNAQTSTVSSCSTSVSDNRTSSCPSLSTSPNVLIAKNNSSCNSSAKKFKLNPGAKVFSPTSANSGSAPTVVTTIASTGYISNIPPAIPIAAAQSGIEINSFSSRPSLPAKLVQCNNFITGHNGIPAQFSRPIMGHAGARQQPVRYSGQCHPVQAGPPYVQPTSQTVMVGRMGQLLYVHPIAQDAMQGASIFSQGSPYPLLNPCQTNIPKIQGTAAQSLQLCMAPPIVTGVTQPCAVPTHIPFSQPFRAIRPIPVPGGNGFFGSKFQ